MRSTLSLALAACVLPTAFAQPASFNLACLPDAQRAEAQTRVDVLNAEFNRKRSEATTAAARQAWEDRVSKRDALFDCDAAAHRAGSSSAERCIAPMAAFGQAQKAYDAAVVAGSRAASGLDAQEAVRMRELRAQYPSC